MAKVTKEDIKAGFEAYALGFIPSELGYHPVKIRFTNGILNEEHEYFLIEILTKDVFGFHLTDGKQVIFPGDAGIEGFKYDNRPCQVFTTEEEAQAFINLCAGRNPNWVDEDGNYHEPYRDWEDDEEEDYYSKNFTEDY